MLRKRLNSGEQGFTLFEAMIALAILTLGLGAFYRAIATGAAGEQRVERSATALAIAQARLAAEGLERPLTIGRREGDDPAGFHWAVSVRRYDSRAPAPASAEPDAYLVTSTVTWPGNRSGAHPSVELTTLKLAPAS